ncbi:cytochrome b [Xylanimonas sp. McL0601]|uniref:cytochrome b n=1 Tax=Xylanimonas sp. McL0601 TaxID=3414739 RepID=UPI003CE96DB7
MRKQGRDRWRELLADLSQRRVHLTWASLLAVVTATCMMVLAVTGILLVTVYQPSSALVTYDGVYGPLAGARVSEAFDSVMTISLETAGGLLVRQAHHWAALVMPASLIMQLLATFFSGGFRRPRQAGWLLLVALFVLVLLAGWSGYALPDDMLSGTGLRIVQGVTLAIPVVGSWASMWLFGGEFPGKIIEHLYAIHLLVPVSITAVLVAAAVFWWRTGPTVPVRAAATGSTGIRLWPDAALKALGMSAMTTAVLVLLGALATITPVWAYGPSDPGNVGAGSQPDWYMGFLDGALRLVPSGWETEWLGATWTFAVLVPLLVVGAWFVALTVYPFLESWVMGDAVDHHVLERPRNAPVRTGVGVAGALVYGVLWGAASADIVATRFHVSFESVITVLQVTLVVGPPVAFGLTRRIALGLQRKDREIAIHGHETGRIVRTLEGGYVEIHAPVDPAEGRLLTTVPVGAVHTRTDQEGRLSAGRRLRGLLGSRFAEGYVRPVDGPLVTATSARRVAWPGGSRQSRR